MILVKNFRSPMTIKRIISFLLTCLLLYLIAKKQRNASIHSCRNYVLKEIFANRDPNGPVNLSKPSVNLHQVNDRLLQALLKTKQSYSIVMKKLQKVYIKESKKNQEVLPKYKEAMPMIKNEVYISTINPKSKQSHEVTQQVPKHNNNSSTTRNTVKLQGSSSKPTEDTSFKTIVKLRAKFSSREDLLKYINQQKLERQKEKLKPPQFAQLNMRWNWGSGSEDYYRRDDIKSDKEKAALKGLTNECYDWTYDAADYTVIYKPTKKFQSENCSYPSNEIVKRIITPNQKVIWKGCTKNTSQCGQRAHFDTKRNLRRNTPPCCRHHLLEMLKNIDRELMRHNITYTLADGAVIGWYRNRKLVPYDTDLDMYVDGAYFKTQTWDNVFKGLAMKYGYDYEQTEEYKYRLRYSAVNGLQVDIWPYFNIKLRTHYGEVKPGEWLTFIYHSKTTAVRVNEIFPPKRTTIEGVPVNVPRDTINFLNKVYGPTPDDWLPELTCKTMKSYVCA